MTGIDGEVTLPSIGAQLGTFQKWSLKRREDGPTSKGFVLHAVFAYPPNDLLWNQESFTKRIVLTIKNREKTVFKQYRVEPFEEMVLKGRALQCEGVELWPLEE